MHKRWRSPSSDAGQVQSTPAKASNSSSDEYGDGFHRRNEPVHKRMRKFIVVEDDEDEDDNEVGVDSGNTGSSEDQEEEEDDNVSVAKPIGDVVRVSGSGVRKVNHYKAFEYEGYCYKLEDPVLTTPGDVTQKPYVAIIKDITHNVSDGEVMLTGQCFYRPEDAKKKEGGSWIPCDSRELFCSFHQEEFAAETVLHTCVMNFIPSDRQLPDRKQYPGFIIQKVYDTERMKLFNLTDKDFEDTQQSEINRLVNETMARLGYVPAGLNTEDTPPVDEKKEGLTKGKTLLRERNLSPMDKSKKDELKEGLTAEEIAKNKPKDSTRVQMLDVRCKRCSVRSVSRSNIRKAGTDQYELVCMGCGFSWCNPRDKPAALIDEPTGPAPLDTTKLNIAEKKRWAASVHQRMQRR